MGCKRSGRDALTRQPLAQPVASLLYVALACRCPRCGKGRLFRNLLEVRDTCDVCGLDLTTFNVGDGAAAFLTLIVGGLVGAMAVTAQLLLHLPFWLHAIIWPLITIPLAVALIRPAKAALIAMQYRHRATEMGL